MPCSLQQFLRSDRLPTLPEVAVRVIDIARQPDPDLDQLAEAVQLDPAIAARLMKTANSALLGMRTRASSIEAAVARLGSRMVRTVILGMYLANYQSLGAHDLRPFHRRLWREMLFQAVSAQSLAEHQNGAVEAADWFLAGLLQDIGRLALLTIAADDYVDNVIDVDDGRTQLQREQDHYGFTHVDVSLALGQRWYLEEPVLKAISTHHHSPHRLAPLQFSSSTDLAMGLLTASCCTEYIEGIGSNLRKSRDQIERLLLQVFAFRPNEVFRLLADIDSRVGEYATLLSVDLGALPSREQILSDAEDVLEQIAQEQQMRLIRTAGGPAGGRSARGKTGRDTESLEERYRDPLTGLFNQRYLEEGCPALHDPGRGGTDPLGLLTLRISGLRQLPDSGEDDLTERFLIRVATLLRQSVRLSDSVVRNGPDTFTVVMTDVNLDMLVLTADQLRATITDLCRRIADGGGLSCSTGVLLSLPTTRLVSAKQLLAEADKSLRAASKSPGSRSVVILQNGKVLAGESAISPPSVPLELPTVP